jgi:hypothetical protein
LAESATSRPSELKPHDNCICAFSTLFEKATTLAVEASFSIGIFCNIAVTKYLPNPT